MGKNTDKKTAVFLVDQILDMEHYDGNVTVVHAMGDITGRSARWRHRDSVNGGSLLLHRL